MTAEFSGSTFKGSRQPVDGFKFDRCTFDDCTLVYSGGEIPAFVKCSFTDTQFEFEGAAARTLVLLQAMSEPGSGLQEIVRASLPAIAAGL